ncbi:MAG: sulfatase-like hydrolase/transferase [Candidatus Latescibacterota bacterium]|nr:sulfatase-like hydrolase/transferase [Candidatus Latescibacterota bacterium]
MRCIMVMFDSLNRHMLPPYNADTWVHTPNFRRLAEHSAIFDTSYVCSMPCMPARRDLHTGRPNFLHCPWGPLEPFDDSVPQMLQEGGVYTHLCSDHYHYWEDGGATYHGRYNSWEFYRGQEGDPHIGHVADPEIPDTLNPKGRRSDWVNRPYQRDEKMLPQSRTFEAGLHFLDLNKDEDNWFLQLECFDPHEPFVSNRRYTDLYPSNYDGPLFDWPGYGDITETPAQVEEGRRNYAALMSKCDASLGDVLDAMDRHDMWNDTMLILWTDHGFLLGEHGGWAKNWPPLYEQLSHTPFFVWDPRCPEAAGQRRSSLVQPAIDLGPTLLGLFGQSPTDKMIGKDIAGVVADDSPVRDAAIFGYHGNRVNITDGRYVYYRDKRTPDNQPLHSYTLMTMRMRGFKGNLGEVELAEPFSFTEGMHPLRIPAKGNISQPVGTNDAGDLLYDLQADPEQTSPIDNETVRDRLASRMTELMLDCDAPPDQFERMGLSA